MDHNHDPGTGDTMRDIDHYMTNSIPDQHYNDFLAADPANGGYNASWDLSASQVTHSPHDNWHSQSMPDQNVGLYPQQFTSNQTIHPQSASPYPTYQDPPQGQTHQAFDPSLTGYHNQQYFSVPPSQGQYQFQQPQQQHRSLQPQPTATSPPQALQPGPQSPTPTPAQTASKPSTLQINFKEIIPAGQVSGIFTVISAAELSNAANSRQLSPFIHVGIEDFEFPINKAVLPARPKRRSRNELRALARGDATLLAKLGKSSSTKVKRAALPNTSKAPKPKSLHKQIQTIKGSKREEVGSSGDESSGSESYDSDSDEEAELPNPLPLSRPEGDARGALRYDTLKAVFRAQRSKLPAAEIRKGLGDFWTVIQPIRAQFKTDVAALKDAKEKEQKDKLPSLEKRVRSQCDSIEIVLSAALQHGHRSILATFSENLPFLQFCFQILLEVSNQGEIDSKLPKSVLECLAMCNTLTEDKLTKTRLSKVFPRFLKKGNAETQSLIRSIETKSKEATRFYETDLKAAANESSKDGVSPKPTSVPSPSLTNAPSPRPTTASSPKPTVATPSTSAVASARPATSMVAGVKRPASGASTQPTKKVNGNTAAAVSSATGPKKAPVAGPAIKATANVAATTSKTDIKPPVTAVKTKTAVSKPSAFFNNAMQSATKKPASAAKPAVSVVAAALKSVEKMPAEPAAKSSFSFADTMASLSKPAEKAPTPKPKEENLDETPEEKRRRLRKEARRGLRVKFKPDGSLVEVRFLEHDPNEDERADSNMKRDVSDVGGEGRMFKQHKDQVDLDEDEDATGPQDLKPFSSPNLINFDDIDPEERERNVKHLGGGSAPLVSPEKDARETYEANTLMVYYANPADIPPTPKEPVEDNDMASAEATKDFGAPSELVMERAAKLKAPPQRATTDISAILAALQPKTQPPPVPVTQQPAQTNFSTNVHALLSQFQQNAASQQAPVVQQQPSQPAVDLTALLASLQGSKPSHPPAQPQIQAQAAAPVAPQLDLASLMASLQGNRAAAVPIPGFPPPPQPGAFPPSAFNAANMPPIPPQFLQQFQQLQQSQQSQQQQQSYPLENEERRRMRETAGGQEQSQNQPQNFGGQNMPSNAFTQPCKYWPEGRCFRGNNCTFKH